MTNDELREGSVGGTESIKIIQNEMMPENTIMVSPNMYKKLTEDVQENVVNYDLFWMKKK